MAMLMPLSSIAATYSVTINGTAVAEYSVLSFYYSPNDNLEITNTTSVDVTLTTVNETASFFVSSQATVSIPMSSFNNARYVKFVMNSSNPSQVEATESQLTLTLDTDGDRVGDEFDNCTYTANPNQLDNDGDAVGDACDNCRFLLNPTQTDTDSDIMGDACDNCPTIFNLNQENSDDDVYGNKCDCQPFITNTTNDYPLCSVTDLSDDLNNWEAPIYPNPAKDELVVAFQYHSKSYTLLDNLGNVIETGFVVNGHIPLLSLSAGLYTILISNKAYKFAKE
jgi:hypothetical protein